MMHAYHVLCHWIQQLLVLLCRLVLVKNGIHGLEGGGGGGTAGILVEASRGGEDYNGDLDITEDGQLLCFLQQTTAPLAKVACLLPMFSILLITILPLAMLVFRSIPPTDHTQDHLL
jgi:hypothetical protein